MAKIIVMYQHALYREDAQCNPDVAYLFGETLSIEDLGKEFPEDRMRGMPNAFPLTTRFRRKDFLDDSYLEKIRDKVSEEIGVVKQFLGESKTPILVWGSNLLDNGLLSMRKHAPKTHYMVVRTLKKELGFNLDEDGDVIWE